MKKLKLVTLFIAMICCFCALFVACADGDDINDGVLNPEPDEKARITAIEGGTVDKLDLYLEVGLTITSVDLSGIIKVSAGSTWQLYNDITGQILIPTKYAANLLNGENKLYIVVNSPDGKINRTYTLSIWKNFETYVTWISDGKVYKTTREITHTKLGDGDILYKEGYTFLGWGSNGYVIEGSCDFIAQWKINTYTLSFNSNGGSVIPSQTMEYYSLAMAPTDPIKAGFIFVGWFANSSLNVRIDFKTDRITRDTIFYAKWLEVFNVTFETSTGSAIAMQKVADGKFAIAPASPIKTGFSFEGWYKEVSLTAPFNFETDKITADTVIYAKWLEVFNVTFETSAGSAVATQKVVRGKFATMPADPIKAGFSFDNWYKEDIFATSFNFATDEITADTVIYAKWLEIFNVTFETGTGSAVATQKVANGKFATAPADPIKTDFSFAGWYKEAVFTTPFNFMTDAITTDTIIYAKWFGGFDVTFSTNGGSEVDAQKVLSGNFASQPTNPSKVNDLLECWCKDAGLTIPFNFETDKITGDTILYAKWKECAIDYFLDFTFIDSSNSAYSIAKKSGVQIPDSIDLPMEYRGKPVSAIRANAFSGCSCLTRITIPSGITDIGNNAFYGCSSLTSILIPKSVATIGEQAFNYCNSLTIYVEETKKPANWNTNWNVGIPAVWDSVNNIIADNGNIYVLLYGLRYALKDGNATVVGQPSVLTVANIPKEVIFKNIMYNVTCIGERAFNSCSSLASITIPSSVTSIGTLAFDNCSSLTSITIPSSVTSIGSLAFDNCSSLTNIKVDIDNANYKSIDGNLYSKDGLILIRYAIGKTATEYAIPTCVTKIGRRAFASSTNLIIVTIPACVIYIEDSAFTECSNLQHITFEQGSKLESIGESVFFGCSSLINIIIPSSVISIGYRAFDSCRNLTSIIIPKSVVTIGKFAFNNCDRNKLIIYAEETREPANWDSQCNPNGCTVNWGYKK